MCGNVWACLRNAGDDEQFSRSVQVSVHVLKDKVDVFVVVCLEHVEQLDDVRMVERLRAHGQHRQYAAADWQRWQQR
jgi:hypothetical protein